MTANRTLINFCLAFLMMAMQGMAQKGNVYRIQGIILDKATKNPITGVAITMKSLGLGVLTDKKGYFMLGANEKDTILIQLLGHDTRKIPVQFFLNATDTVKIVLSQEIRQLSEVTITEDRFVPYVNTEVSPYKPIASNAFASPITAIYEQFSKRHQNFQKVLELQKNDEREWYVMRRLTLKKLKTIIPITEKEYYDFLDYCHFSIQYILSATEYELIVDVKKLYREFKD